MLVLMWPSVGSARFAGVLRWMRIAFAGCAAMVHVAGVLFLMFAGGDTSVPGVVQRVFLSFSQEVPRQGCWGCPHSRWAVCTRISGLRELSSDYLLRTKGDASRTCEKDTSKSRQRFQCGVRFPRTHAPIATCPRLQRGRPPCVECGKEFGESPLFQQPCPYHPCQGKWASPKQMQR